MRPYLDYILDKEIVMQSAKQGVTVVKERLNKKPIEIANNTIDFMNGLKKDELKEANIKDRISIITWARKVVNKHHHLDIVQVDIDRMTHQVKMFMDMFDPLFKKGLPLFWEEKGSMLSQKEYQDHLNECRLDRKKFVDMQKSLLGKEIVDKLADYFEMIFSFKSTCARILHFSYRDHVELRVLEK